MVCGCMLVLCSVSLFFLFKQKTAYEMRISDWSSDVCSSDLAGSWTLMKSTPVDRAKAAWLYAQFVTSKTVDVKKSHVGLTFIRESTVQHESVTDRAPNLGGLIEFYRAPDRVQWSPNGDSVPDYPTPAQVGGRNNGDAY